MKKIQIHIANDVEFMDSDVCVNIQLPEIPRKGEMIYLKDIQFEKLEKQAHKSLDIAARYAPKWFWGHSAGCDDPKESNLKDLGFEDANYISEVLYNANEDLVHIEIDDSYMK